MKKQQQKIIFSICIICMVFCISSIAQIVYTDVNPDDTVNAIGGIYNIDLDNDGTNDFILHKNGYTHVVLCLPCPTTTTRTDLTIGIESLANNATALGALALIQNDSIDSNLQTWTSAFQILSKSYFGNGHCWGTSCVAISNPHTGQWYNVSERYLAVRIYIGTNLHYGWIKLTVNAATSFIVKEYAYNSIPNQLILAGDAGSVSTGITHNNIQANHLSVYPNPVTNSVTIKFPSDEAGEIQIVNLFGQVVYQQNLRGFENLEGLSETKIDVSKFSEGMYIVRWNSGEIFETKIFSVIK